MKGGLKLGARIILLTLVLSLLPVVVVTLLNVRSSKQELNKLVSQDLNNMIGLVWQILVTQTELVKQAEVGNEIIWILQAREQEKNFIIKEDEESVQAWRQIMARIKKSVAYTGDVPAALERYEAVFDKFSKGMLANVNELGQTGQILENEIRKWIKIVETGILQENIKSDLIGPKMPDGTRDLTKGIRIGSTGSIFFIKPDGAVTGHPKWEGGALPDQNLSREICSAKTGYSEYSEDGREKLVLYKYYEPWNWIVAIDAYRDEVMNVSGVVRGGSIIAGIFAVLIPLMTVFFVRAIFRPVNHVVHELTDSTGQVAAAAEQVSRASQQVAEGSSQQAAAVEETSSSIEEMSSVTKQNADSSKRALLLMVETKNIISQANESMGQLTSSMHEISQASEDTSKIIKTIDEVAFQTNLLALNAAVEAARAGEAGASFAVVAEEVRNLARRAADAAKNTARLIEDTLKRVHSGSQLVGKTSGEFSQVAAKASEMGGLVEEISAACHEQAQGIEQVNKAVAEIDGVVQDNAANAEETASASEEMNSQAEQMRGSINQLRNLIGDSGHHWAFRRKRAKQFSKSAPAFPPATTRLPKPVNGGTPRGNGKTLTIGKGKGLRFGQLVPTDRDSYQKTFN
jgi:methyl-accepting chemotaxis protein